MANPVCRVQAQEQHGLPVLFDHTRGGLRLLGASFLPLLSLTSPHTPPLPSGCQVVHACGFSGTGMGGVFLGIDQLNKYESTGNSMEFLVSAACQGACFVFSTIICFMQIRLLYQARPATLAAGCAPPCEHDGAREATPLHTAAASFCRSAISGMVSGAPRWRSRTRKPRRIWHSSGSRQDLNHTAF